MKSNKPIHYLLDYGDLTLLTIIKNYSTTLTTQCWSAVLFHATINSDFIFAYEIFNISEKCGYLTNNLATDSVLLPQSVCFPFF